MGTPVSIKDEDLLSIKSKTVIVTGGASGIGLATAELLLSLGANVVAGDVNPSPLDHPNHTFVHTDVTSWSSLKTLFATAVAKHARIDHVFANAGIGGRADYFASKYDEAGELEEPSTLTFDINIHGMVNTAYLGLHHFQKQSPPGGSIVCTASAAAFQRFGMTDYTTTKHAMLGFVRGISANLLERSHLNIRMNGIGPAWTVSGLVPKKFVENAGVPYQTSDDVARSVVFLMTDQTRNGDFIFSQQGNYFEVQGRFSALAQEITHSEDDHESMKKMVKATIDAQLALGENKNQ